VWKTAGAAGKRGVERPARGTGRKTLGKKNIKGEVCISGSRKYRSDYEGKRRA